MLSVPTSKVGVFICSCDSRRDILGRVLPSIFKYWPECPYRIYVGLNTYCEISPAITTLVAQPSGWRTECLDQVTQITETHLIVVLDDYLFQRPVNQTRLSLLVSQAVTSDLAYLRLLPPGKSLTQRFIGSPPAGSAACIRPIEDRTRFYSGLHIAIWNKAHFVSLLNLQGSVWDFEHHRQPGAAHYSIIRDPPIRYRHLVEKGRWLPYAKSELARVGLSTQLGPRRTWPVWMNLLLLIDRVRFYALGYAIRLGW